MLIHYILTGLIFIALAVCCLLQVRQNRWVKRELRRNDLAHSRIVERLPIRKPEPFWTRAKTMCAPEYHAPPELPLTSWPE